MTKKEILKLIAKDGNCNSIDCNAHCPYYNYTYCPNSKDLKRIGAMALLRQNRKERREFDPNKVLTCVTTELAKAGMRGYFGDCLTDIKLNFKTRQVKTLYKIIPDEDQYARFMDVSNLRWCLFYPIEE